MTLNERRLAWILAAAAVATAFALALALGLERVAAADRGISSMSAAIARMGFEEFDEAAARERLVRLKALVAEREAQDDRRRARSLADFGAEVKSELLARGVEVRGYRLVSERGLEELEFSLRARPAALFSFLEAATDAKRRWAVGFLSVRAGADGAELEAVARIGDGVERR